MLRLQNVSKEYRLGQIGYGTLNKDLQSWWARIHRRPDPNLKLGREKRLVGDTLFALRDINLTVYEGERVGVIGGNGAGKSTLLKLISRVTTPTTGTIDLYGRVTSMLEVGTGFHGEMTGRENIYLNGTILGMNRREIDQKLEEIIDFSEIRDYLDTPVKRYSSGMYVKLAFAVAAHLDSEIVIMDEVLAVGDEAFQKKCIQKMRAVAADENRTVLYVSHNMETVRALCDRCIVLSEGQIVYQGATEDAIRYYRAMLMSASQNRQDVGDLLRRDKNISGLCKIISLEVENHNLGDSEPLRFRLQFHAEEAIPTAAVRLIVSNSSGQLIGMSSSDSFELSRGDTGRSFELPAEWFGTGEYVCDIAVFSYDRHIETRHDFLSKIISFRINRNQLYFGLQWLNRKWGNIVLPTMRTEAYENGKDK